MTIRNFKMGPGTLTLDTGTPFDVSTQLTNCRVEWSESVDTDDAVPVLSGETLAEEDSASYTAKLSGTVVQDLEAAGFVAFTWAHKGETVAFTFIPSTTGDRQVTGNLRVAPITLGGDVKKRNTSDLSFAIIGDPDFTDVVP